MKWLMVAAMLAAGPFEKPEKLPPPPVHPVIKFLSKDMWSVISWTRPCVEVVDNTTFCVRGKYPASNVTATFTWRF
jgi:hypothetical protein